MSNDKEKLQRETDKDEWEEETKVSEDNTVEQRNPFEAVREANHLAWVAIWVSVVAVVISVVSAMVSMS